MSVQLKKNLDTQDFYMNIWTEMIIGAYKIKFMHPWFIKDPISHKDIFPDKAQNDIDKAFEPSIAIVLEFSMKNDKELLSSFQSWEHCNMFTEIKDFGKRIYVLDFGVDIQKAVDIATDILQKFFDLDNAKKVIIATSDIENNKIIANKTIRKPKKVDGTVLKVVDEKTESTLLSDLNAEAASTSIDIINSSSNTVVTKEETEDGFDNTHTKSYRDIVIAVFIVLFIVAGLFATTSKCSNENSKIAQTPTVEEQSIPLENDSDTTIVEGAYDDNMEETSSVQTGSLIGKWKEIGNGDNGYVWSLVKDNGKYTLSMSYSDNIESGVIASYSCKKKRAKNNQYLIHDPDVTAYNGMITIKAGETIYVVSDFEGGQALLLIFSDGSARMYSNDVNARYYEFFAQLQSI